MSRLPADTVHDVWLSIDGQVDTSSIATLVRDVLAPLGPDAGDEERVLALHRFVCDHLFVFPAGSDLECDFNQALRLINWWGHGLCFNYNKVMCILAAHALGFGRVRQAGVREREPGSWRMDERGFKVFKWSGLARGHFAENAGSHASVEFYWDGSWHMIDPMMALYRRREDGGIASLEELGAQPALMDRPAGERYGDMPFGDEREVYTASQARPTAAYFNHWPGAPLALTLRPGESFTWLAEAMPGHYHQTRGNRERWGSDALAPGPQGHQAGREGQHHGNGEHRLRLRLQPHADDPYWRPESADWRVPVHLPYPVIACDWRLGAGGGGFLYHEPSTGDRIEPIKAIGRRFQPEGLPPACGYELIVRSPGREDGAPEPIDCELRSIVQLNPLVTPRLRPGGNIVHLRASGEGEAGLRASFRFRDGDQEHEQELSCSGAGTHELQVAADDPRPAALRIENPSGGAP